MEIPVLGYVALAILANTLGKLVERHVAKDVSPVAFAWLTQLIAPFLLLPLAWSELRIPVGNEWLVLLGAGAMWSVITVSVYVVAKRAEVSIREPLQQSKLIWTMLLGLLVLGEPFKVAKVIGTLVVFLGMCVLLFHPERRFGSLRDPGVLSTLGYAVLLALSAIVDKYALGIFKPGFYSLAMYSIPLIILTPIAITKVAEVKHLLRSHGRTAVISIALTVATYYLVLNAYARADITFVYPLLQLASILAILGAMLFLGEREHRSQRIIASLIVIVGAIIVKLG